ncbi:MAG: high-potential iron-sulfur protein [Candidatus Competibacteraceae bacterium]|jgi:hypothetical protein|nr:high-potential iron-sulfur protein [Candidatus Competibacteraceae bacterium]
MNDQHPDNRRRSFLKISAFSLVSVPIGGWLANQQARAADMPQLDESDPTAQALGYVHDATKANVAEFPKRSGPDGADQFCRNCQLYTGSDGSEWGPCSIFPGKVVNANGWCNAWVQKAG